MARKLRISHKRSLLGLPEANPLTKPSSEAKQAWQLKMCNYTLKFETLVS